MVQCCVDCKRVETKPQLGDGFGRHTSSVSSPCLLDVRGSSPTLLTHPPTHQVPFLFKHVVDALSVGAPPSLDTALFATPLALVVGCTSHKQPHSRHTVLQAHAHAITSVTLTSVLNSCCLLHSMLSLPLLSACHTMSQSDRIQRPDLVPNSPHAHTRAPIHTHMHTHTQMASRGPRPPCLGSCATPSSPPCPTAPSAPCPSPSSPTSTAWTCGSTWGGRRGLWLARWTGAPGGWQRNAKCAACLSCVLVCACVCLCVLVCACVCLFVCE
jgi:hypothetical protein